MIAFCEGLSLQEIEQLLIPITTPRPMTLESGDSVANSDLVLHYIIYLINIQHNQ
jgi:hypothetical protein